MKRLLPIALSCILSLPAEAQFLSGVQLKADLDEAEAGSSFAKRTIAMGYVAGVYDLAVGREVCPDRAVSAKESMGIVHRYLRAHPERLPENAAPLAVEALREAFPCKK
jgi:hypothetical protein